MLGDWHNCIVPGSTISTLPLCSAVLVSPTVLLQSTHDIWTFHLKTWNIWTLLLWSHCSTLVITLSRIHNFLKLTSLTELLGIVSSLVSSLNHDMSDVNATDHDDDDWDWFRVTPAVKSTIIMLMKKRWKKSVLVSGFYQSLNNSSLDVRKYKIHPQATRGKYF